MGFFDSVRNFVAGIFGGGDNEPPIEHDSAPDYSERDTFAGADDDYSWQIAGYVPQGEAFDGGYVNFDPDSPGTRVDVSPFPGWDFLPSVDYAVVKVWVGGDSYYVTLGGPFEDWDDLAAAIADWYEQGS